MSLSMKDKRPYNPVKLYNIAQFKSHALFSYIAMITALKVPRSTMDTLSSKNEPQLFIFSEYIILAVISTWVSPLFFLSHLGLC